jgi:hypothetical protein
LDASRYVIHRSSLREAKTRDPPPPASFCVDVSLY